MLLRSAFVLAFVLPALIVGEKSSPINTIKGRVGSPDAGTVKKPRGSESVNDTISFTRTPGKLRVVENSGVCETTPGVYQASGYGDLTADKSMWFWFFAARNNPETAPLITWFNGGPGSSSMLGLFLEIGPCRLNNQSTGVDLNPTAWNNNANVLFIDQPIGVGFSYGDTSVGTSPEAAADVWTFLQIWFADTRFKRYASLDFGIWTESYGGRYGPVFATYFLEKNQEIYDGTNTGVQINLKVLGIGNGLIDPFIQYHACIRYAKSNPYHPLVNDSAISAGEKAWTQAGGCKEQITACNNGGNNSVCAAATNFCNTKVFFSLEGTTWDPYYVLASAPDSFPPVIEPYLDNPAVASKIGGLGTFQHANVTIYNNFSTTGDWMRASRPDLEKVINAGVQTILYDGDADYYMNFLGLEALAASLKTKFSSKYAGQNFANFTVNGVSAGLYKNAGTFSYVRFFELGHAVPMYMSPGVPRGAAALQMFTQIMSGEQLYGT